MNQDLQHLKLLSVFYYVVGALIALFSCFALLYLLMGVAFVAAPPPSGGGPPPPVAVGWFFIVFSAGAMLFGWAWAVALMLAGWYLGQCRNYLYCFILGCSAMLFQPFGIVLGVFTIVVLIRPTVKRLFATGGLSRYSEDPDEEDHLHAFDNHVWSNSYNIQN